MMEPIALTLGQKFEVEKFSREIDSFEDLQQLRDLAKDLLVAWKQQQASTAWVIRQKEGLSWQLGSPISEGAVDDCRWYDWCPISIWDHVV